ncbi:MAG TPA: SagB/ThcOx family dehydrogenase [Thermodesulfobacteriota bacterium]|nr:SagB/ThcOx family dehydrogenase [Thermodesulfobacteriota bacterium]
MTKEMNRREFIKASAATGAILMSGNPSLTFAQELKPIQLLAPQLDGGRPLMQVLRDRKSSRLYSTEKIPLQVLSNLLWAAFGINRPERGLRTAPSGRNRQDIDIYVAMSDGVYVYDAKANLLNPVVAEDVRSLSGRQHPPAGVPAIVVPQLDEAPINFIYVSDGQKWNIGATEEENLRLAFNHTGYISQNVYLYCASEGLATIVRAWFDKATLEKKMKLRPDQKIILVQSVGYPKKTS